MVLVLPTLLAIALPARPFASKARQTRQSSDATHSTDRGSGLMSVALDAFAAIRSLVSLCPLWSLSRIGSAGVLERGLQAPRQEWELLLPADSQAVELWCWSRVWRAHRHDGRCRQVGRGHIAPDAWSPALFRATPHAKRPIPWRLYTDVDVGHVPMVRGLCYAALTRSASALPRMLQHALQDTGYSEDPYEVGNPLIRCRHQSISMKPAAWAGALVHTPLPAIL